MNPDPVSPNPQDLESLLARRRCPEPEAGLRECVLAAVRAELGRPARSRGARTWSRAWQAAAAVVLALNLALSAANGLRYQSLPVRVADPPGRALPGPVPVAETDDRPWRLAASAVARLAPAPDAGAVARHFFEQEGN
jgi:hypothetical protein